MIELVIAACLGLSGTECRNFSLLYDPYDVSLMTCTIHGQQAVAEWHDTHPDWTVARWSCGYRPDTARDI